MSERKRSLGITIMALLVMASGFLGLVSSIPPQPAISIFIKPFGILLYITSIVLSLAEVVLSFNIMRLKEWARALLVAVMLANVVVLLFSPFFYTQAYLQSQAAAVKGDLDKMDLMQEKRIAQMRGKFEERIQGYPQEEKERMRHAFDSSLADLPSLMLRMSMFLAGLCAFIWYAGVMYFFTRRKVVDRFE